MDKTQALWFADSRNWIPDSSFVELGFLIPNVSSIPDSFSGSPYSKPGRLGIPDSTSKNLPGIQSLDYLTRGDKLYFITTHHRLLLT